MVTDGTFSSFAKRCSLAPSSCPRLCAYSDLGGDSTELETEVRGNGPTVPAHAV
jgi:hypothetical protein